MFRLLLLLPFVLVFNACDQPGRSSAATSLSGVWESVGYGKILAITDTTYAYYDLTDISCLPAERGLLSTFGDDLRLLAPDTLLLSKGTGCYWYVRNDETLPADCSTPRSAAERESPIYNFDVATRIIGEHYAYFTLNGINWDSLYAAARAQLHTEPTELQLYRVLDELITTLHDNHGYVEPSDAVYEQAEAADAAADATKATSTELPEYGDLQIAQIIAEHHLTEDLTKDSWLMRWGKLRDSVGYLQVNTMWLYADLNPADSLVQAQGYVDAYVNTFLQMNEGRYIEAEVAGIARVLDQAMADLSNSACIVLDLRFNGGGQDAVSREILRRFNDRQRQVATKRTWVGAAFTTPLALDLPAHEKPFLKPVYVLTSQQTGSAAEYFSLASRALPHFRRLGASTQGALSDALEKQLPNGWTISVSNEEYRDLAGQCYENTGVPVDYTLAYPADRQAFFRSLAENPAGDKAEILAAITELQRQER